MTTVQDIIVAAFRENNLKAIGQTPTTAELSEALARYTTFLAALIGHEMGVELTPWVVPPPQASIQVAAAYPFAPEYYMPTSDVYLNPPANKRIINVSPTPLVMFFPFPPLAGNRMAYAPVGTPGQMTFNGNGFYIDNAPTVAPVAAQQWLFRDDLNQWLTLNLAPALTDVSPFPVSFDDLLITGLSIRLSARYDKPPGPGTVATYKEQRQKFTARYAQTERVLGGARGAPNSQQAYPNSGPGYWGGTMAPGN